MDTLKKTLDYGLGIFKERKILFELARNDFRSRFTNSLLGIAWAFLLPVVIILVLWFVFEIGFKSTPVENVPFILWYIPAFLVWNFFSEAFSSGANCLFDYYYLVKNMKFKVSILPFIKIISASFIHLFFVGFIFLMYFLYGRMPRINNIQVIYYYISLFFYVLGLTWLTSALSVFSRDVLNIITLIIQVGFWATPLIWDPGTMPQNVQFIVKLNPMYYICCGYREAFSTDIWFWQHPYQTLYFWLIVLVQLIVGAYTFKKLRPQFADML